MKARPAWLTPDLPNRVADGLVFAARDVRCLYVNDAAVAILRKPCEERIGYSAGAAATLLHPLRGGAPGGTAAPPRSVEPGNGGGVAICKRIVERHGGTITAENLPGRGSIFRFTLPSRHPNDR